MVSLPNHTFTGQVKSSKRLTSSVHILSSETDTIYPSILRVYLNKRSAKDLSNNAYAMFLWVCFSEFLYKSLFVLRFNGPVNPMGSC